MTRKEIMAKKCCGKSDFRVDCYHDYWCRHCGKHVGHDHNRE